MAFKPYLVNVIYQDTENAVTLFVEHRDGVDIRLKEYTYSLPLVVSTVKSEVLSANNALTTKPTAVNTLESLIDKEIT